MPSLSHEKQYFMRLTVGMVLPFGMEGYFPSFDRQSPDSRPVFHLRKFPTKQRHTQLSVAWNDIR